MLIDLQLGFLDIPFRMSFRHASAERSRTESLWVEARSISGRVGYGESCPRSYVTGESKDSARRFFLASRQSLIESIEDATSLRHWVSHNRRWIDENPAAWCAIELASLDLLAKDRDESVEASLGVREPRGSFHYSAVLGDCDLNTFTSHFDRYWDTGLRDFKLKLSGEFRRDREKIDILKRVAAPEIRLRVDANNLWDDATHAGLYLRALKYPFFAVEEPVRAHRYSELSALASVLGTRIIVDESLAREDQLQHLDGNPESWIVNLRVSKAGGLFRSLELLEAARRRGHGIIVGAQVGETSLLTRAALTVAAQAGESLVAQEGAFGCLLLERDICNPPLMFGKNGVLKMPAQRTAGFGLDVRLPERFLTRSGQWQSTPRRRSHVTNRNRMAAR